MFAFLTSLGHEIFEDVIGKERHAGKAALHRLEEERIRQNWIMYLSYPLLLTDVYSRKREYCFSVDSACRCMKTLCALFIRDLSLSCWYVETKEVCATCCYRLTVLHCPLWQNLPKCPHAFPGNPYPFLHCYILLFCTSYVSLSGTAFAYCWCFCCKQRVQCITCWRASFLEPRRTLVFDKVKLFLTVLSHYCRGVKLIWSRSFQQ